MVTWQFILLLLGTQLIYTWYCLISLHCLEALDITWCHLTDLSLSGSSSQHWHWTWVAWDNLKQCQLSSSSSKSFQSKIGFSWWVVSWKLWMIYGYSQNIFRNVMSDKQFENWCKKHSSRPRQRECTWWASIQFFCVKGREDNSRPRWTQFLCHGCNVGHDGVLVTVESWIRSVVHN